jgi:hypothetical protein
MWLLVDGVIDARPCKELIGNSGRSVEFVEHLELVFLLA